MASTRYSATEELYGNYHVSAFVSRQVDIPEDIKAKCREAAKKAAGDGGDDKPAEVFVELAVRARDSGNNLQPAEVREAVYSI